MTDSHKTVPPSLFSRSLEREARMAAWADAKRTKKRLLLSYYAIDTLTALLRAFVHTVLWTPAVVMWPLMLTSNGLTPLSVQSWLESLGSRGWDGALLMLAAAVFVLSMAVQFFQGGIGRSLRAHLDRSAERSLIWSVLQDVLPPTQPQGPPHE